MCVWEDKEEGKGWEMKRIGVKRRRKIGEEKKEWEK